MSDESKACVGCACDVLEDDGAECSEFGTPAAGRANHWSEKLRTGRHSRHGSQNPSSRQGECQKVWGNQAAHASVAGVLPGPRFWGDIVDACELLVDHRVDNPLYDPGRGTRLLQRCRLAVCGSCGHISARIRHCPTLFGTPVDHLGRWNQGEIHILVSCRQLPIISHSVNFGAVPLLDETALVAGAPPTGGISPVSARNGGDTVILKGLPSSR